MDAETEEQIDSINTRMKIQKLIRNAIRELEFEELQKACESMKEALALLRSENKG